jgi:glycosyltransferase involved in cell wall biosynthesis
MTIDIVVTTRNRADRLRRLLDSLRAAERPPALGVRVIVADNDSSDLTAEATRTAGPIHGVGPLYLHEPKLGKSHALNRALGSVTADLVGLLDDDERVDAAWLNAAFEAFQDDSVAFISGPCRPEWGAPPPPWLPPAYPAVIGWVDGGPRVAEYHTEYGGSMMGGNAVIRSVWVQRIGGFDTRLGRFGAAPGVGEDADYYERLIAAGARGLYVPRLAIDHYVPPERLAKSYYRRWVFRRGEALARIHRARPQPVRYVLGVPRYMVGSAARGLMTRARSLAALDGDSGRAFAGELSAWELAGFVWARLRGLDRQAEASDFEAWRTGQTTGGSASRSTPRETAGSGDVGTTGAGP